MNERSTGVDVVPALVRKESYGNGVDYYTHGRGDAYSRAVRSKRGGVKHFFDALIDDGAGYDHHEDGVKQ